MAIVADAAVIVTVTIITGSAALAAAAAAAAFWQHLINQRASRVVCSPPADKQRTICD